MKVQLRGQTRGARIHGDNENDFYDCGRNMVNFEQ